MTVWVTNISPDILWSLVKFWCTLASKQLLSHLHTRQDMLSGVGVLHHHVILAMRAKT